MSNPEDVPSNLEKPSMLWVLVVLVGLAVLFVILFALGLLPRLGQHKRLNADAREMQEPPIVNVAHPIRAQAETDLVLPGNVLAWQDTGIYARTTGYIKKWYHDLGDVVKEGELLAVIDAPEVDQQLEQARAQLGQSKASKLKAQADLDYNVTQLKRFQDLRKISAVSQQQLDQQQNATDAAQSALQQVEANIVHDEANVRQFTEQQSWERVTAPFAGKITARNVEVGALIMPGTTATNSGGGREMFHMAQTDMLRVMIAVPQSFVTSIRLDQPAMVYFRDNPKRGFVGKVARFSGALDQTTRTLLTEVDVPNPTNALTPGMYMQVGFSVQRNVPPLLVPQSALIFNAQGTQVAVLRKDGDKTVTHFQLIGVGRDTGAEIEAQTGLNPGDLVVVNPGERLVDGGPIKVGAVDKPIAGGRPSEGSGILGTPGAMPFTMPASEPATSPATMPGAGNAK